MDRDRTRPRDFEDQYGTGRGQSYRPGGARERTPPPRADTYRARSPPRRPDYGDTYRGPPRPRSRTPVRRDDFRRRSPERFRDFPPRGGDSYRARPRSPPPRREDLPRDDLFRREPQRDYSDERMDRVIRDERDRDRGFAGRSPLPRFRDRSPLPLKRTREPSPIGSRGRRTPPPAKRERLASPPRGRFDDYPGSRAASPPRRRFSPEPLRDRRPSPPRGGYRPRSRSPLARNDRVDPRTIDDWRRPRSPSPPRYTRPDYPADETARTSGSTSRRTSPPPALANRMNLPDDRPSRPALPAEPYENREPYRARSPEPRRRESLPPRPREQDERPPAADERNPPPREPYRNNDAQISRAPPSGPSAYRNSATAAPPAAASGPPSTVTQPQMPQPTPPSGPRGAAPPSAPRGHGGFGNEYSSRGGRGNFSGGYRGGRGGNSSGFARNESYHRDQSDFSAAPPSGPRNAVAGNTRPSYPSSTSTGPTGYQTTPRFGSNNQGPPESVPSGPAAGSAPSTAAPPTGPKAQRRPTDSPVDVRRPSELVTDFRRPSMDTRRPTDPPTQPRQSVDTPTRPRGPAGPHPALASLPVPTPGGIPAAPLIDTSRVQKLQQDAERLRRIVDEKEQKKRKGLREWDRLQRETSQAALRSDLAIEGLTKLEADGRVGGLGEAGW